MQRPDQFVQGRDRGVSFSIYPFRLIFVTLSLSLSLPTHGLKKPAILSLIIMNGREAQE